MSRWKAVGMHLCISLAIGITIGALLLFVWYPRPYFHAAGVDELILLLAGVDVVLGPLLTLVIFRSGKKGLKVDLALIAIVQSAALLYGLSVVLRSRPVFIVAAVDRFTLVSASDIDPADLAKGSKPAFRSLSWVGPRLVAAILPPPGKLRTEILFSSMAGKDIERMPRYYADYAQAAPSLLHRAKPLSEIPSQDEGARERLAYGIRQTGKSAAELMWLPIVARRASLMMLVDRQSGAPLQAVAINPWPR